MIIGEDDCKKESDENWHLSNGLSLQSSHKDIL